MHAEVKILALMLLAVVFGCGDRMRQQLKTVMFCTPVYLNRQITLNDQKNSYPNGGCVDDVCTLYISPTTDT